MMETKRTLRYIFSMLTLLVTVYALACFHRLQYEQIRHAIHWIKSGGQTTSARTAPACVAFDDTIDMNARLFTISENSYARIWPSMRDPTHAFPNALYQCDSSPTGSVCRGVHITTATMCASQYIASGDGLHQAVVGHPAIFHINISGVIPPPLFSVLAVGRHHMFSVQPSPVDEHSNYINFTYTPTFPGEYELYVEQIHGKQLQVPGSPFHLVVDGPTSVIEDFRKRADALPPCQTVPQFDHSWVRGEWVSREFAGKRRGTLRSGWVLQPDHCSFDIFGKTDLKRAASAPKLRTIVVLGRSIERGIFLSLVDIALEKGEKVNIDESKIGKCWGFAEVQLGSLRFIYQDYRLERVNMANIQDEKHINITCHNEKQMTDNRDYFADAIGFLREFLFSDRPWPDVIILTMKDALQLKLLMKAVPDSWKGIIYPMNNFKTYFYHLFTAEGREKDIANFEKFPTYDKHIRVLDAFAVAQISRHGTESAPLIMTSMHWHKWCSELDGEIRVCSDATEMMAQILLGRAIAPDGKDTWISSLGSDDVSHQEKPREIRVCHDCPVSLAPFHIKKIPNLMCYQSTAGLRRQLKNDIQVWKGSLCPRSCMETEPIGEERTGMGYVDVRICTVLKANQP